MWIGIVTKLAARAGISLAPIWAGAIIAFVVAGGVGLFVKSVYDRGFNAADEMWTARALQSKIDAANKDRDIAQRAAADAALKLASIEADAAADRERTGNYVADLERRSAAAAAAGKPDACELDDADLRGMSAPAGRDPARTGIAAKALRAVRAAGGAKSKAER